MKKLYKKLFALTDDGAKDLTVSTFASFMTYCINMLPAILTMILMDELVMKNTKSQWLYIAIAIFTLLIMRIILDIEYDKLYSVTYKESENLRIGIADYLANLPLSYFSKHDLSDISQTIMVDVDGIEHAMSHSIPKVGAMLFFFPLISVILLIGNVKMGLAIILPTILSFLMIPISKNLQIKGHTKYYKILRENSESFQETIELQQEIKSFNMSKDIKKDLHKKMDESEKIHLKSEFLSFISISLSSLLSFVSLAVVILVGINLVIKGEITIVYLIGYTLATIKIKETLDVSKEGVMEIFYLTPKIKRIKEIRETHIQEGKDTEFNSFNIELKNVAFSYEKDIPVIKDVSFKANQGEVTALVGASGCGKTSILRLVSRLYDYDDGQILIDGKDIKNISTNSLFKNVSIVFQDVTLFNTSVLENIRIGRKDASDDEVKEAAKLANCTDFIEKLENGFDTKIGENGAELSGGERQRLSIARAFLKNAPILILDEIAASLDVDNEKKIQESLNRLIKDKTVIIISHRLKSVENADKIVVLEDGQVESIGTHNELFNTSKVYRNLINKTKMAEEFIY